MGWATTLVMIAPLCQVMSAWLPPPGLAGRTTPLAQCTPWAFDSGSRRGSEVSCEAAGDLLMDEFCACNVSVANKATMVTIERNNRFIQPPEQDFNGVLSPRGDEVRKEAGTSMMGERGTGEAVDVTEPEDDKPTE